MKYLRKYKKFFEDDNFEIEDSDDVDVKMSKEKLNELKEKLSEYNSNKSKIESIYKSDKEDISDDLKKIVDGNGFLLSYSNILSIKNKLDKLKSREESKKLELSEFRDKLSDASDENKQSIIDRITTIESQLKEINDDISDKSRKIPELEKKHNEKMSNIRKEMEEWINNIK